MHRIHSKDFSRDDFSTDHMTEGALGALDNMISFLEESRIKFTETKDKKILVRYNTASPLVI